MVTLGTTNIQVHPLCLGGDSFGWGADERQTFEILDAYVAAGGNWIDTADIYCAFVDGNSGGESETFIGRWMKSRGNRDRIVIATKVGSWAERPGLSAANILAAADDSLRRLQTDHIDIYYAHRDRPEDPLEETLGAFDQLVRTGKVRTVGASNYSAERLKEALDISTAAGWARYDVLQTRYNLVDRDFEDGLREVCLEQGLATATYSSLALGFLTGKYSPGAVNVESARITPPGASFRGQTVQRYLDDDRAWSVLAALRDVAEEHGASPAAVALSWLAAQPAVSALIASVRRPEQLSALTRFTEIELSDDQYDRLTAAGV